MCYKIEMTSTRLEGFLAEYESRIEEAKTEIQLLNKEHRIEGARVQRRIDMNKGWIRTEQAKINHIKGELERRAILMVAR